MKKYRSFSSEAVGDRQRPAVLRSVVRPAAATTAPVGVSVPPIGSPTPAAPGMQSRNHAAHARRRRFRRPLNTLGQRLNQLAVIKQLARLLRPAWTRAVLGVTVVVLIASIIIPYFQPDVSAQAYNLGSAASLLSPINDYMAGKTKYDAAHAAYNFNDGYSPLASNALSATGTQVTATVYSDASKGFTVSDPTNQMTFGLSPQFSVLAGKQAGNRIVYPFDNQSGWLVYTLHGAGIKEDIVLRHAGSSTATFQYNLQLGDTYTARLQKDGSIGVYGSTMLSGNVATGSQQDAALLQKARQRAPKNNLLFVIPAPTIDQQNRRPSNVTARYQLQGSTLKLVVSNLDKGEYPLTIDPSIYVETAEKFMHGNNETNVDFDVVDTLIQKGKTTGARFDAWNAASMPLNQTTWSQGVAVAGGYIYTVGGTHPSGGKVTYSTVGPDTFTVPAGITSITIKAWGGGAGGGGGGRNSANTGGNGGGAGFSQTTLTVSPGDVIDINVGGGGGAGNGSTRSGQGGAGGGYSDAENHITHAVLLLAAGGGGGGGGAEVTGNGAGDDGFAGGGTTGGGGTGIDGRGGTSSAGGAAGSGGLNAGTAGASKSGGAGGDGRNGAGADGGGPTGGTNGGGNGGNNDVSGGGKYEAGGGGGGGGYYGGGGGSGSSSTAQGGAGGGGSSYTSGTGSVNTAGSGQTPGNSSDPDIGTAGQGGNGGSRRNNGTAGTSGLVIVTYSGSTGNLTAVNWAKFNTTDGTLGSPDPGTGTCSGWCTSSAYDLPTPRVNMALIAYNGFLYALGGEDSSCTTGNGTGDNGVCKTVYIAKLGANGEPRLWHPTDTNQNNWVFWYRGADLSSPRSYAGATAYNNRVYLLGGKTSSGGVASVSSTVEEADVTGTGTLSTWTTSGMVTLRDPSNNANTLARFGFGVQAYNDYLYVIGGASSLTGTPMNNSQYIKLKSDGTMAGNWLTTTSFSTGRVTNGGNFTTAWGAYIYISGGCTALNASGYCTAVAGDTQLASINADGSLDIWNTNASVSDTRMGYNLVAWRSYLYEVGGCSAQDASTGACTTALSSINIGTINQDGDASTVNQSVASGTAPCSGANPYSCNLPGASVGNVLNETAIINGYLYIMGGCSNNACSSVSNGVLYQAIGSDGSLQKPAACTGTYTDSFCVSSASLPAGLGAAGVAVFGGRIYLVGGFNTGTNIYYVSVNGDGSLGTWANVGLSGITTPSTSTLTYSYAYARANPSAASTNPGNLYIIGGCTDGSVGCSNYSQAVFKCNINTSGVPGGCNTSGQLQIGAIPGGCGTGLGAMVGAVYANYIYLMGGLTPNCTDLKTARYAQFDNNNNIVTVGSGWVEGSNQTANGRRRGAGFGYNGYLYVVGGYSASSGVLADIEFAKINVSDGSWGPFSVSSVQINGGNGQWGLSSPVSNSYAYVIGGCTAGAAPGGCTSRSNVVQTFQIYNNDSGAPAGYSTTAACGTVGPCTGASGGVDRIGGSATIYNGYIYYAGGCTVIACTTVTNTTFYAPINTDGTIGTWAAGGNLPAAVAWGRLVNTGGTLYYVGGQNATPTAQTAVYYTSGISAGNPTWATATNGLPNARSLLGVATWNGRIYAVGGTGSGTGCTGGVCNTVYASPQQSTGGNITSAWSTSSTSFNVARSDLTAVAYANNLYIFGGIDASSDYLNDSQFAQISTSTGNVGSWTYSTSLPNGLADSDGFAVDGYIYLVGGRSAATSCRPLTLVTPVSANTTIATGNNPTGVGDWFETNQRFSGDRYGAAAAYTGGKAYVVGGGCSAFVGSTQRSYLTALLTQPQVAKYSIMFDTDTDVFPQKWLLNGLDNSIGAKWQLSYRSQNNTVTLCGASSMSTWGQTTNFGDVTLGTPGVYNALDGSGVNINCARFFYMYISIDSSLTYGYPDDVSRGPTITDLTLEFTSDPSKRLMHGRTFTGGLQQPDDTPF